MKVTPAQWEEARAWLDAGETLQMVADRLGVARQRVSQKLPNAERAKARDAASRAKRLAAALEAVAAGASIAEAAATAKIHRNAVAAAVRDCGVPYTRSYSEHAAKRRAEATERAAVVVRLYRSGMTTQGIADALGMNSQAQVYPYLRRAGVAPDRNPQFGDGHCRCGCGALLTGRRTTWATSACRGSRRNPQSGR